MMTATLSQMKAQADATNKRIDAIVGKFTGKLGTAEYRRYLLRRHEARKSLMA